MSLLCVLVHRVFLEWKVAAAHITASMIVFSAETACQNVHVYLYARAGVERWDE